ncbi:hypothetical protein SAMN06297468_0410 [Altererythrobacter xiamenensis]|uniref:DUF2332 domain-containing protein n=1 Tax=Altererythrobacter xiamenensis TaxID=1316679 RepID=A0A1Y6ECV4_9SPHN|nr:DUF2332 domain-containing protein [Altererythrobacter xiamenensis]SMQ60365.1 hypothetical protein SAMN06297468_0410 [Altererythrobacter xiamenensis]
MVDGAVMDITSIEDAIEWQARHAEEGGAPGTAKVIRALLALLDGETAVGRRIANWQGLSLKDAMPLRIAGGLHNLVLRGADTRLADVYAGRMTAQPSVDALVCELVSAHDAELMPWLDGPPQTNEAGRSASLMAGLLWLAGRVPPRFEMLELGASAGINTMMDRYHYELGGVAVGPDASPMSIAPEWRGEAPPDNQLEIVSIRGCDISPVDLTDEDAVLRLKSYVWPEASLRMHRIDAAAELAGERKPDVVAADAADFVEAALAEPQEEGTTRVLFHSIVWQYIPEASQGRIEKAMASAAENATTDRPLAWMKLETNRETFRHELRLRYWPGGAEEVMLAHAHPHGAWVEWTGAE